MTIDVRLTQAEDFPRVFNLLTELWPDHFLLEQPRSKQTRSKQGMQAAFNAGLSMDTEIYLSAMLNDTVVGFACISLGNSLYHGGRLAWVEALVSDKSARGQGVGTALMERVVEEAIRVECKAVEIMIDNQAHAVKFVKNKGFQLRGNSFELKLTIPR